MSRKSVAQPIKTENAGIGTASVNIRILQVNKKQMTLAVFRQITASVFHDRYTGALRADINLWGKVNYFTDNWGQWAVGSCNGELLRSKIEIDYWQDIREINIESAAVIRAAIDEVIKVQTKMLELPQLFIAV